MNQNADLMRIEKGRCCWSARYENIIYYLECAIGIITRPVLLTSQRSPLAAAGYGALRGRRAGLCCLGSSFRALSQEAIQRVLDGLQPLHLAQINDVFNNPLKETEIFRFL